MTDSPPDVMQRDNGSPAPGALIDRALGVPGQATRVEMERAVAEVQGAIIVAQRVPRSIATAVEAMRETCGHLSLAERAFFSYPRGKDENGKTNMINGASVHLARELARIWGNVQYGLTELSRDDDGGWSQMMAWAWDVQTNTRASTTVIVPHRMDTKRGVRVLTDVRDIYENNANMGARRVREQIFAILPPWFTEDAKQLCHATITRNASKVPLQQQAANAIQVFQSEFGVSALQLEAQRGRPTSEWTQLDLTQLQVLAGSLRRGEVTAAEVFAAELSPDVVTPDDIMRPAAKPGSAARNRPGKAPAATKPPRQVNSERLHALCDELGLGGKDMRDARLAALAFLRSRSEISNPAGVEPLGSSSELEDDDLAYCVEQLAKIKKMFDKTEPRPSQAEIRREIMKLPAAGGWQETETAK